MRSLKRLSISRKLGVLALIGLASLAAVMAGSAYTLRDTLDREKMTATQHVVELAHGVVARYHAQAASHALGDEEAKAMGTTSSAVRTVHLAVYDTLADWEVGLATAHINNGEWQRQPGSHDQRFSRRKYNRSDSAQAVRLLSTSAFRCSRSAAGSRS